MRPTMSGSRIRAWPWSGTSIISSRLRCRRMAATVSADRMSEGHRESPSRERAQDRLHGQAGAGLFGYSHHYGRYPGGQAECACLMPTMARSRSSRACVAAFPISSRPAGWRRRTCRLRTAWQRNKVQARRCSVTYPFAPHFSSAPGFRSITSTRAKVNRSFAFLASPRGVTFIATLSWRSASTIGSSFPITWHA
jgi:hypothetical protein